MELLLDAESQIETWQEVILVYNAALKQINTKLEILNDEFQHVHQYNPIEHIKSRIKTSESIVKKLRRHGYESTIENMVKYVNDIAGIRVICSFTSDIYRIAEMIRLQNDIHVIDVKVEIQIRTVAMDFWASLEHKINYKFEGNAPEHVKRELIECAGMVSALDNRMQELNEEIKALSKEDTDGV